MRNFLHKIMAHWADGKLACVGLDSSYRKIPEFVSRGKSPSDAVARFNQQMVDATAEFVCAFKPNVAFYPNGLRQALVQTCKYIRRHVSGVPIVLDFKRGDIGSTNAGYVVEGFEEFEADAVTVNPYMGHDPDIKDPSFKEFLEESNRGVIVLCRTSNKDAAYLQDRPTLVSEKELDWVKQHGIEPEELGWQDYGDSLVAPQYQLRAIDVAQNWNKKGNCGLVVGATAPQQLAAVRRLVGYMPILVPGIGAQGGDLEATLKAGLTKNKDGLIINSSRGVIFAASDHTYLEAARAEVQKLNTAIRNFRELK